MAEFGRGVGGVGVCRDRMMARAAAPKVSGSDFGDVDAGEVVFGADG